MCLPARVDASVAAPSTLQLCKGAVQCVMSGHLQGSPGRMPREPGGVGQDTAANALLRQGIADYFADA